MAAWARSSLLPGFSKHGTILRCKRVLHTEPLTREPVYPPILPSRTAKSKSASRRREEDYFNKIRSSQVEEKIRLLTNLQRKKYVVYPQTFALNADRWYQHFTKTAYLSGLPEKLSVGANSNVTITEPSGEPNATDLIDEKAFSDLRSWVCDSILQENFYLKKRKPFLRNEQQDFVAPFLSNLVSHFTSALSRQNAVLRASSLDFNPQVNFYWMRGERTIPRGHRSGRVDPIRFQIDDNPHCQIRVPQQLPEFVPLDATHSVEVPEVNLAPDLLPLFRRQYDNNIFTGSKVADPCSYGHTQFHLVADRFRRDRLIKANLADQVEVGLRANAIASLFAWTGAQAMYQGFWSHEDVSRPFASQAVITDGRQFSFFCYQLNTLALSMQTDMGNARKNLCWGRTSLKLYEAVTNGDVIGWDDTVLELLVRFLMNRPQPM